MTIKHSQQQLIELYKKRYKQIPDTITPLPSSGSDRIYFRLKNKEDNSVIGAFNANIRENEAFFSFTQTFQDLKINVPELLAIHKDKQHYLISDLGDQTLFQYKQQPSSETNKARLCQIKLSLLALIKIQLGGGQNIDFSKCYPREQFDHQSIQWDLNYFKYDFLKIANIPFDEQALEDDFQHLKNNLLTAPNNYFMYRDFQTRNIMIHNGTPWFIDYQGGRKGPLQYDLASILYSPKTGINTIEHDALLDVYISELQKHIEIDKDKFTQHYYSFVLIRILQAMGAYGFRGIHEKKANFRNSIPTAIKNLNRLFTQDLLPIELPELEKITSNLSQSKWAIKATKPTEKLRIRITSFSYKKGIPEDPSNNGGGFVFDCRGLPNPGRLDAYKTHNGQEQIVIDYLEKYQEVIAFQNGVQKIVKISIDEYLNRGFNHLCINFGCTGGQHRSVYNAQKFCQWVENNYPVDVVLIHREKENWRIDE